MLNLGIQGFQVPDSRCFDLGNVCFIDDFLLYWGLSRSIDTTEFKREWKRQKEEVYSLALLIDGLFGIREGFVGATAARCAYEFTGFVFVVFLVDAFAGGGASDW